MTDRHAHWQDVWTTRRPTDTSWYQDYPAVSLALVREVSGPDDGVVDVGGGISALVVRLADAGYRDLTVVDLAEAALTALDEALAHAVGDHHVQLVATDVLAWRPGRTFRVWHDRAAFHFLVDEAEREAYAALAADSVEPGGHVVLAAFAPDGPEQCSGLPVHRSGAAAMAALFSPAFTLVSEIDEDHLTPWQSAQHFQYVVLCRQ